MEEREQSRELRVEKEREILAIIILTPNVQFGLGFGVKQIGILYMLSQNSVSSKHSLQLKFDGRSLQDGQLKKNLNKLSSAGIPSNELSFHSVFAIDQSRFMVDRNSSNKLSLISIVCLSMTQICFTQKRFESFNVQKS